MSRKRTSMLAGVTIAVLVSSPALAAPASGDLLVVTPLTDPDPNYVPPPPEPKAVVRHRKADAASASAVEQAFENLGRVTGQAAQMMRQRGTQAQAGAVVAKAKADAAALDAAQR